jgi:hypothetical protein
VEWGCCWHLWVEDRDAVKCPAVYRTTPQQRIIYLQTLMVLRLRNPDKIITNITAFLKSCPSKLLRNEK